jgi:quinol monooxygenase YgiN
MLIVIVNIHIIPEHIEAFRQATMENARNSIKEPGIARFDLLQQTDDPTHFVLYEAYRSEDAPAKHRETEHYNKWAATVADMFAEPRTRAWYHNVAPPDEAW